MSKNKNLITTKLAGYALAGALILVGLTSSPILPHAENARATEVSNVGVALYHSVWENTKQTFVFTDRLKDWSAWEHKYDDKIKSKADGIKYAKEMVDSLKDPYTRVLDEKETKDEKDQMQGKFEGVGIQFAGSHGKDGNAVRAKDKESFVPLTDADKHPIARKIFKGAPAFKAGLKAGDAIVSVNGKSTEEMTLKELTDNIRGPAGTKVTLKICRQGKTFEATMTRQSYDLEAVSYHKLPNNLGYIRIDSFIAENTAADTLRALRELKSCDGYVLDLRDNPGGLLKNAVDVAGLFEDKGVIYGIRERSGNYVSTAKQSVDDSMPHIAAKKPLVILVDNGSASASEILTGSLRDNRHVKLIGLRTFGKGLVQHVLRIDDEVVLHVTVAQWTTPNGTCPGADTKEDHPNGFVPDITLGTGPYFEMDSEKDNQLNKAIETLKQEMGIK